MEDINAKRHNFKVEIRRKHIEDRISVMRANLYEKTTANSAHQQFSDQKISALIQQTLTAKKKLIKNISPVMYASYHLTPQNINLFFPLIPDFCYVIEHLEYKNQLFGDIATTLINISSFEIYEWPPGDYLFLIKHLLKKQRETNTMWLLANILCTFLSQSDQRITPQTQQVMIKQLVSYQSVKWCEQRLLSKFQNEYDVDTFGNFVCAFLTHSQYLTLENLKRILKVLEDLCLFNSESVDLYILMSMADHAPYLAQANYELLHSKLIPEFKERYIKKKKTPMIVKFLDFVKNYISREIFQTYDQEKDMFADQKIARKNYERICQIVLPNFQFLIENRSPEVSGMLMETCCMLVDFYFPFIDLSHQDIFINLAKRLNKSVIATLSKYSDKAIYWQLRMVRTLLFKLNQHKIETDIIAGFIEENQSLEAFINLLKDKKENNEIIEESIDLLTMILGSIQKDVLLKNEKHQLDLTIIVGELEKILDDKSIKQSRIQDKIQKLLEVCELKLEI